MKTLFLHLSDIHIKTENDFILKRGESIAATTFIHLPDVESVFIIISGDTVSYTHLDVYKRQEFGGPLTIADDRLGQFGADLGY